MENFDAVMFPQQPCPASQENQATWPGRCGREPKHEDKPFHSKWLHHSTAYIILTLGMFWPLQMHKFHLFGIQNSSHPCCIKTQNVPQPFQQDSCAQGQLCFFILFTQQKIQSTFKYAKKSAACPQELVTQPDASQPVEEQLSVSMATSRFVGMKRIKCTVGSATSGCTAPTKWTEGWNCGEKKEGRTLVAFNFSNCLGFLLLHMYQNQWGSVNMIYYKFERQANVLRSQRKYCYPFK